MKGYNKIHYVNHFNPVIAEYENKEYENNGYHLSQVPSFLIPFTWSSIK